MRISRGNEPLRNRKEYTELKMVDHFKHPGIFRRGTFIALRRLGQKLQ